MTPLMAAAKKGQRDVVKVLLAHGADVTAVSVKVQMCIIVFDEDTSFGVWHCSHLSAVYKSAHHDYVSP